MAKRKSDISLSFVLLRFAFVLLGSMLLCLVAFLALQTGLERAGLIYHGSVSNQQAEAFLAEKPKSFLRRERISSLFMHFLIPRDRYWKPMPL